MNHPILGEVKPSPEEEGVLMAAVPYQGTEVDFVLETNTGNEQEALLVAATFAEHLESVDLRVRGYAADELLAVHNNSWRSYSKHQPDGTWTTVDSSLVEKEQFISRLSLESVRVSGTESVELAYNDGDLFWGHWVVARSFSGVNFEKREINFEG